MIKKTLVASSTLEARPAALFVQTASKYISNIQLSVENKTINAKSIMGIISLGVLDGHEVTLSANGSDEKEAIEELTKFLTE